MYLHHIALRNIRGFKALDFDLARPDGTYAGWTVFTGDNGSGKSTLLKVIAMCLVGAKAARILQTSFNGWIRHGGTQGDVLADVVGMPEDDLPPEGFGAHHVFVLHGQSTLLLSMRDSDIPEMERGGNGGDGWFSCGYGPFRRVFGASPEVSRQMASPLTARFVTMFSEAASLAEADSWLRDLNYKALEGKADAARQRDLVIELLNDNLMPNQITVDRVDSDGLWLKDRDGVRLSWGEMSDGYRSAVALLVDILRHLIHAYGVEGLIERGEEGRLAITRSGVVLIDEIDAHLHPEWQREIGFWLKQRFPKIQFIVTTHSPLICQAADPNGIFVLPEPGSGNVPRALTPDEYQKVIASRSDTILLSPAFGLDNTRSPLAVESRAKYARLSAKRRAKATLTEDERREMDQLALFVNADEEP